IHDVDVTAARQLRPPNVLLDRHAGIVRDFLPQTRDLVEEGGLAGVRWSDEGHERRPARAFPGLGDSGAAGACGRVRRLWHAEAAWISSRRLPDAEASGGLAAEREKRSVDHHDRVARGRRTDRAEA